MSAQNQTTRDKEILILIAQGHAKDEERIRSGELHPDSMFFISRERAQSMKIVWNNSVFEEFA